MATIKQPIQYYNRYSQQIETEAIYGEPWLRWAYETRIGRRTTKLILKRAWFSAWYGWRMDAAASKRKILPFIQKYNLDASEFAEAPEDFKNFNEFFYRSLKPGARTLNPDAHSIVFPADGRHLGFQNIGDHSTVAVKGQVFDLATLLQSSKLAERYKNGSLVLSRLCPVDYHRFHFPVTGTPKTPRFMHGDLLSVSPIALRRNLSILWQNRRVLTEIQTPHIGTVLMLEIGATCVGHIHQTFKANHKINRGAEKGYFKFGGSATLLLFEPGRVQLAEDLITQTSQGLELYARMGDTLARSTLA